MRYSLLLIACFAAIAASAQYKSRLGRFQVDEIKGCAPFKVTITNANLITSNQCTAGAPCLMDYEGKGSNQNLFTFTYNTPGTYKLSVLYQSVGADDITITVVDPAPAVNFDVYSCAGSKVMVKVQDTRFEQYVIDFQNDNVPETVIPSGNNATAQFSYPSNNPVTIAVRGRNVNSADNCPNRLQAFTPKATLTAPSITTQTTIDNTSLKLDMVTVQQVEYKMEIGVNSASAFQVLQTLYQVNTTNVCNLLNDNNYYCFRLSAHDPCANTNTYSNTICSQDFDVSYLNGVNQLTWRTGTSGIGSVEIKRNKSTYTTIPGAPLSYQDKDYTCNQEYCYQITANYAGGAKSTSLEKCGIGVLTTTYPAIDNVTTTVTPGVSMSWTIDPKIKVQEFQVWRAENNSAFTQYSIISTDKFTDDAYTTEQGLCYLINYSDACANNSLEGIHACPVRLFGVMDDRNVITLNWTRYSGWKNGVNRYELRKFNQAGTEIKVYNVGSDTSFVDDEADAVNQVVSYEVRVISNQSGLTNSNSNRITFIKEVNLAFPTAFTPNGDAINPTFIVSGQFISKMKIKVFDRWGLMVFASETSEPWNGTREGKPMPQSTYVWKAEIVDYAGHQFSREGTTLLIRP